MGGHSDGSRAADTALKSLLESFRQTSLPMFDPLGFLHMALSRAHDDVAKLGNGQSIDTRPRATTAICLVQEGAALLGAHRRQPRVPPASRQDRAAHPRSQPRRAAAARRQDHRGRAADSPDAQFRRVLPRRRPGDSRDDDQRPPRCCSPATYCCLCTDGIWANLRDTDIAGFFRDDSQELRAWLEALGPSRRAGVRAVQRQSHCRRAALARVTSTSMKARPSGRAPDELRPVRITRRFTRHAEGSVLDRVRRHARAVHGARRGWRALVSAQHRPRLGHGRVRHAAALDSHAQPA